MSALAVGYVFQALLKPDGAVNGIIGFFLGHPVDIAWLGSTTWTIVVVALIHAWKWMGLSMLIYLAGLKTINQDLLEAARLDGADWWTTFRLIRFPLLAPAVTFNVATALLGSMNGFDIVQATTDGGPGGTTELAQHLHLPHLRPGPVRAGHDDEPGALPRGRAARLPRHPHAPQARGRPVSATATVDRRPQSTAAASCSRSSRSCSPPSCCSASRSGSSS